jgi:hypothetical protein
MVGAGDVNGDRKNDLVAGETRPPWGGIDVYLGGTRADRYSDYCVNSSSLPPQEFSDIGRSVAHVGDWNGDGYDDICFSTSHFPGVSCCPGYVLILAGSPDIQTDVAETKGNAEIHRTSLESSYPNPFNLSANIKFYLEKTTRVSLIIYNLQGQIVVRLVDAMTSAGQHVVRWDGRSVDGKEVASGVYFCVLSADSLTSTVKMLFLK